LLAEQYFTIHGRRFMRALSVHVLQQIVMNGLKHHTRQAMIRKRWIIPSSGVERKLSGDARTLWGFVASDGRPSELCNWLD
jgi:hypothetical protein